MKSSKSGYLALCSVVFVTVLLGVHSDAFGWPFGPKKDRGMNPSTKLKLKVYNDLGGNTPALLKTYFHFLPVERYDDSATTPFPIPPGKGEYNVKNTDGNRAQMQYKVWGQTAGRRGTCWVYKNVINFWHSTSLDERYARTAAHEMGHRTSSHGGRGEAPDKTCTMYQDAAELEDGTGHFCTNCETGIFREIGGR